jgi:hypothetical protein
MNFAPQHSRNTVAEQWPALPLEEWKDTYHTLHMWTQIAGKIRIALMPLQNHWWNAALYLNTSGLTTSPIPYRGEIFEIQFDFINHRLEIRTSYGAVRTLALAPKSVSVAVFYHELLSALRATGIEVEINRKPQEVPDRIPFDQDETHRSYDPEYAHRCWRILLSTTIVLNEFRSRFIGKSSPVHFFWGSFDLASTRFSGRVAPPRKGAITSEAYSHECSSVGWWPGSGELSRFLRLYRAIRHRALASDASDRTARLSTSNSASFCSCMIMYGKRNRRAMKFWNSRRAPTRPGRNSPDGIGRPWKGNEPQAASVDEGKPYESRHSRYSSHYRNCQRSSSKH